MKKQLKRMLLLTLVLAIALLPALALADSGSDDAGNMFASDGAATGKTVEGDLYGVGQNVDASNAKIGASAILVGQYISANNSMIGGSLRTLGYQISAANTTVDRNATLAAYSIVLGQDFSARAVYSASQSLVFAGTCDTLGAMGQNITISGTVNGDVNINAETVTVTDTAVITGNLNVEADSEPAIAEGASVGAVHFTKSTSEEEGNALTSSVAPVATGAWFVHKVLSFARKLVGGLVLAVLYYFVIRGTIADGASMMKTRAVAMPVSGLITLISLPIAAVILMVTVIGVPAGVLLLLLYGLALGFSASFAGCMLGKLVFPKMHTLVAYIIGVAAVVLVKCFPVVGGVVTLGSMAYTLGYFIQKIYLGFGKKPENDAAAGAQETQPIAAPEAQPKPETETL